MVSKELIQQSLKLEPRGSDFTHLQWLEDLRAPAWTGLNVLDLGCGSGFLCDEAMRHGAKSACGVDFVKPEFFSPQSSWTFVSQNLDDAEWYKNLSAKKYDLILAFDILEHVASPYLFLKACFSLMAESSQLIITTPNLASWERFLKPDSWSGVIDEQHKVLFSRYSLNFLLNRVSLSANTIEAPMRSLSFLGPFQPQIGGQILCKASPSKAKI